jgi:hypothetical protein
VNDKIIGVIALAAMLLLATRGLSTTGASRAQLQKMALLWVCIFAVIALALWILRAASK